MLIVDSVGIILIPFDLFFCDFLFFGGFDFLALLFVTLVGWKPFSLLLFLFKKYEWFVSSGVRHTGRTVAHKLYQTNLAHNDEISGDILMTDAAAANFFSINSIVLSGVINTDMFPIYFSQILPV